MSVTESKSDPWRCERVIIHVDMDAFYAAVEQRDEPSLRGKPVVVGGDPEARGVVSAASYEARRFGVHSAMPAARARRLCPQAVFLKPSFAKYTKASRQISEVFLRYTPLVEPLSLDESFLDVTGSLKLFGPPEEMAARIKGEIHEATALTASAGVAPNKFLAKIASDLDKPDGLVVVRPGEIEAFLRDLPLKRMWGLGEKSLPRLTRLGLKTIGDLRRLEEEHLVALYGENGRQLYHLARGEDTRPVVPDAAAVTLGSERTFAVDLCDPDEMAAHLQLESEKVAARLRAHDLKARNVILKVRYGDFTTVTRTTTLSTPTNLGTNLYAQALKLLRRTEAATRPVRLLGVTAAGLTTPGAPEQASLFAEADGERRRRERVARARDEIVARFGEKALLRGGELTVAGEEKVGYSGKGEERDEAD